MSARLSRASLMLRSVMDVKISEFRTICTNCVISVVAKQASQHLEDVAEGRFGRGTATGAAAHTVVQRYRRGPGVRFAGYRQIRLSASTVGFPLSRQDVCPFSYHLESETTHRQGPERAPCELAARGLSTAAPTAAATSAPQIS